MAVDGYVIDIVRDNLKLEIQTSNFSSIKSKLKDLVGVHRIRLIYPIAQEWKKPRKFQRVMISRGFAAAHAWRTWVAMRRWQSVYRKEVLMVMSLEWFREMGLVFLEDFILAPTGKTGTL